MHWKFDIDQRSLLRASDDLDFYRGAALYAFTGSLKATVKPTNQQQGFALAAVEAAISGDSTVETVLSLATTQMAAFVKDFGERPSALELLVLDDGGAEIASWTISCDVSRRYTGTNDAAVDLPDYRATQFEAEAGVDNTKWMTPLRVWQAIRKWADDFFKWENLQNKPATFPPSPHIHTDPEDIRQALSAAGIELMP
jgi:hypothetical protein